MESVAPPLRDSARDYSEALDEFTDREIILNVLRARDGLPLNFADISSIIGSVSFSGSTSATIPFGPLHGSNSRNAFTPSLSFSSSPTFNIVPLNTSGFTINIVQPIPPTYVLSKWKSGLDRAFLLKLFIKRISVGDEEFINEPGDPSEAALDSIITSWAGSSHRKPATIKAVSLLEPLGSRIAQADLQQTLSAVGAAPLPGDGAIFVGLEATDKLTAPPATPVFPVYQLYRRYPGQVVICADPIESLTPPTPQLNEPPADALPIQGTAAVARGHADTLKQTIDKIHKSAKNANDKANAEAASRELSLITPTLDLFKGAGGSSGSSGSTTPAASAPSQPKGGGGQQSNASQPKGSGPAALATSVSQVQQSGRISDVLSRNACVSDQIVLAQQTEEAFMKASQGFVHVEWRSVAELIQYLGLVMRPANEGTPVSSLGHSMFSLDPTDASDQSDHFGVLYHRKVYTMTSRASSTPDYTRQSLTLISELLNASKISQDIPITSQLQVVP